VKDEDKTKEQLINELAELRQRTTELEASETERKRAEQALRESEAELSAVFDNVPVVMILVDRERRVRKANRGTLEFTGRPAEEIIGLRGGEALRCLHSLDDPKGCGFGPFCEICTVRSAVLDTFEIGRSHHRMEANLPFARGEEQEELTFLVSTTLLSVPKDQMVLVCIEDITERKRAEKALRQYTVELEARNEELDAFAHTVAHDLKGPLAPLLAYAEILEADYASLPGQKLQEYLRKISQFGHKMSRIIDELLLLAEVRKMEELTIEPLNMARIVAEARGRMIYLIEEHQAEIISPDAWPVALGYGPWVEGVWVNYLSNAIQYGGRPPRVELGATEQADGMVRFWVRDNGPGLTPEEQARLFTPFTQLIQVRARGHGLGLSIVRRIVEKLGGQVGIESELGQGSVFTFALPGMDS
jgi:signal transduction histidine kinase